jgi:hypothetical protein
MTSNEKKTEKKTIFSYRFLGIRIIDVVLTIIGAFIIQYILKQQYKKEYNVFLIFTLLFIFGEIVHLIFGIKTQLLKNLNFYK